MSKNRLSLPAPKKGYPKKKLSSGRRGDESPLTPLLACSRPNVSHLIRKLSNADRSTERSAFDRLASRIPEMNSPSSVISLMRIPSTLNHNAEFSNGGLLSPRPWKSPISKTLKEMLSPSSDEKYSYNKYVSMMRLLSKRLISLPKVSNSKDLAIVAWACGRSNFQCDALTTWMVDGIQELVTADMEQIRAAKSRRGQRRRVMLKCTPGLISSFMWFVSKHSVDVPDDLKLSLAYIAAHQLHAFNDQDFTTLYNSLALMPNTFKSSELTPSQPRVARRLEELVKAAHAFHPDEIPSEKNERGVIISAADLPCIYQHTPIYVLQVILFRLKSLDARRLANFLWAATKCSDWLTRCPVVGVFLIDHVVRDKNIRGFNAQHLSNLYWSCGQILGSSGPREESPGAADSPVCCREEGAVYQRRTTPYSGAAQASFALADLREAFSHLFDTLTAYEFNPRIYQSLSCQGLTIVFAAHARIGFAPAPKLLTVIFARLVQVMGYLHHQHIGHIWWTLGQLRRNLVDWISGRNENVLTADVDAFIRALTAESVRRRSSLTVIQWANLLLGAGELIQIMRASDSAEVRDLADVIMSVIYPTAGGSSCGLKGHVKIVTDVAARCDSLLTASNCIEGMSAAGWRQESVLRGLCKSIVSLLSEYTTNVMSPVERDHTSRLLGGLSTLCKLICVEWTFLGRLVTDVFKHSCDCIHLSLLAAAHQPPSFGATFITRLLHALASVGFLHAPLVSHLFKVLADSHRQITSKTTPRLEGKMWGAVFWAAARLNFQPSQSLFTLALNRLQVHLGSDGHWAETAVNTTLWSLSVTNYSVMSPTLEEAVLKHVPHAVTWLGGGLHDEPDPVEVRIVADDSEAESSDKSELRFAPVHWDQHALTESEVCHCNQMLISLISWRLFHPSLLKGVSEESSWAHFRARGIDSRKPFEVSRCQNLMGNALELLLGQPVGKKPRRRRKSSGDLRKRHDRHPCVPQDQKSPCSASSAEEVLDEPLYLEHQLPDLGLWCDAILPYCSCGGESTTLVCGECGKIVGPASKKGLVVELDGPFHYVVTSESSATEWRAVDVFDVTRRPPQQVAFRGRNVVVSGGTRWKHEVALRAGWDVTNLNFMELQSVDLDDTAAFKDYIASKLSRRSLYCC